MLHSVLVKDYMVSNLVTLSPGQDMLSAIELMVKRGVTGAPVVDERGRLVGILSDTDCIGAALKAGFDPHWRGTVEEFMSTGVETVEHDSSIVDMAERFIRDRYRRYPVTEDNRLVGQISRLDVLRALERLQHNAPEEPGKSNF